MTRTSTLTARMSMLHVHMDVSLVSQGLVVLGSMRIPVAELFCVSISEDELQAWLDRPDVKQHLRGLEDLVHQHLGMPVVTDTAVPHPRPFYIGKERVS